MTVTYAVQGYLLGTGASGANRRLIELLRAMAGLLRRDERIVVFGDPAVAPFAVASLPVQWQPVPIPGVPAWSRWRAERRLLPALLRAAGASLFAASTLPAPATGSVPLVFTLHDCRPLHGYGPRWQRAWFGPLLARTLRRAAAVVVPSQFTRDELTAHWPACAAKVHVVRNGVSARFALPELAHPAPCLLHVGRIEPRKNTELLVTAYARARALRPLPPLVFAGCGHGASRDRLAAQVQALGLAAQVRWLCHVDDDDLRVLYRAAVQVLVPSRYEGFGIPVAEALAAGAPVLVSDQGALAEVGGQALPVDDVAAWAGALAPALPRQPPRVLDWDAPARAELARWRAGAGC